MPQKNYHDHFIFSFRADCTTCETYVGRRRISELEALTDAQKHKSISGNEEHNVKIEVTQSHHILIP
ncbi:hypothetical protein [Pedobacter sp. KLB.chiD]|uniref:hypothetical protein n=1 Tax=Pedobacter sp. KLB.chiD TaxID=3387402 RepID=UPI00399B0760